MVAVKEQLPVALEHGVAPVDNSSPATDPVTVAPTASENGVPSCAALGRARYVSTQV
jgi:hypothetical protein